MRCRTRPTRTWSSTNSGRTATETRVSCHDRSSIATRAAMTVTELDRIEENVVVRTLLTPPTSLASRDWMAPVRVAVNQASSMVCRCAKRRPRSSAITSLPSRVVTKVCATPDRRGQQREGDHPGHQPAEQRQVHAAAVGREQRPVEGGPDQERRDHAEAARHEDQDHDEREPGPVGHEQRPDPAADRVLDRRGRRVRGSCGRDRHRLLAPGRLLRGRLCVPGRPAPAHGLSLAPRGKGSGGGTAQGLKGSGAQGLSAAGWPGPATAAAPTAAAAGRGARPPWTGRRRWSCGPPRRSG